MLILHPQLPVNTLLVLPHRRNVNVPPVRDRGYVHKGQAGGRWRETLYTEKLTTTVKAA